MKPINVTVTINPRGYPIPLVPTPAYARLLRRKGIVHPFEAQLAKVKP